MVAADQPYIETSAPCFKMVSASVVCYQLACTPTNVKIYSSRITIDKSNQLQNLNARNYIKFQFQFWTSKSKISTILIYSLVLLCFHAGTCPTTYSGQLQPLSPREDFQPVCSLLPSLGGGINNDLLSNPLCENEPDHHTLGSESAVKDTLAL